MRLYNHPYIEQINTIHMVHHPRILRSRQARILLPVFDVVWIKLASSGLLIPTRF